MKIRQALAGTLVTLASLGATAQTAVPLWAVSHYGPGGTESTIGCGGCASDQRAVAVDAAGNVFVTGFTVTATNDILTTKFDAATGAVAWQKTVNTGFNAFQQGWALALDSTGNAIITGYSYTGAEYDITTIKYAAADGAILWQKTFTGPANGIDFGIAIATDSAGNVFVGGNVWNGANDDWKVIKYAAADGALVWDKTFAGAAGFNDYAYALAVDAGGNVIAAGEHQLSATDSDWKVIKYSAANGTILWQRDFVGAGGGLDIPYAVAIDAAGNAVVVGNTHNGTNFDARIAKYASADGATLWEKTFNGADNGDDMYYSVAIDASGNAYAAGFSFTTAGHNDWMVAKLAAADGATTWRRFVGGTANTSDVPVTVSLDALGNAVVGGRINNSMDPANRDMHAMAFAGADGAPRWTFTHAGSAGGFDRTVSVVRAGPAMVLAGESLETGSPAGWRVVKVLDPAADADNDGIPNSVEGSESRNPLAKDNDVFAVARLFVMQQYRDFLGREGDAGGITFSTNLLTSGAALRANVIESFFNSPEFQNATAPVARLYLAFFNRTPDYDGLVFQANAVRTGTPLTVVANNFALSPEFVATYGNKTNTEYVQLLYQNVLGRTPSQGEVDYHVNRLLSGVTRGEVMTGFSESAEYKAITANEVYVTMIYVGMLRRAPEPAGLQFWVDYMDAGNPGLALIAGFLQAAEYRNRFLP